jgi:gliding motility-associated-like protein
MTIFNRWGNIIYSKLSYNGDWDATYNGGPLPDGTYYYIFEYNEDNLKPKTGFIEVKR